MEKVKKKTKKELLVVRNYYVAELCSLGYKEKEVKKLVYNLNIKEDVIKDFIKLHWVRIPYIMIAELKLVSAGFYGHGSEINILGKKCDVILDIPMKAELVVCECRKKIKKLKEIRNLGSGIVFGCHKEKGKKISMGTKYEKLKFSEKAMKEVAKKFEKSGGTASVEKKIEMGRLSGELSGKWIGK